ncbi:zinc-dependent metalloprotease [Planctomycetes bacterium TBK1r]|uniref:DUF5117 domain-containing protein n=1 Tax=Stieleria magnilauensis TaxID=2527963 RepID=A0ABX5XV51_9BACT|nr:hypothetical protein TBK1r_48350 [Planctomycetes bacterium TBK1r]
MSLSPLARIIVFAVLLPLSVATVSAGETAKTDGNAAKHAGILKDSTNIDGAIPLYRKGGKLYAEIGREQLSSEYLVLTSIARGIGKNPLLGGMAWGFDDDWVWKFRKIDDRIQIVRRNVRFRATANTPESTSVDNAFTDSVLFSLPIMCKGPGGGDLVDLTNVFMSDLPLISQVLPGFSFSSDRSTWSSVKGFDHNVELEVAATYGSSGRAHMDTVADSRGVTLHIHYSISRLRKSNYQPRLADNRIGYFVTAIKDYSKTKGDDQFVRYINRWNLTKADPDAKRSAPKKPLVFWIEKSVPYKYREPIRDGIAEWNKAFEAAGIVDAIEVRQQPDDADWDPEDINYNTFRWMTANAGFAMGPSRINPYTGEILDADIILDADFVTKWSQQIETLTPDDVAHMTGGPLDLASYRLQQTDPNSRHGHTCANCRGVAHQIALARQAVALHADPERLDELKDRVVMQGLKEVVMHEVGHTLGLRHNFKASTFRSLDQMSDDKATHRDGLAASVMDYLPANIVPGKTQQGDYFSTTIGPYDLWAIQYGYTPLSGSTQGELPELKKIASRSGEPGLAFATDEDTRGIDPDPDANRFDLGDDAIAYAAQRAELVRGLLPKLVERSKASCEGYENVRPALNELLSAYGQAMHFASRYVGGVRLSRSEPGDDGARLPAAIVSAKQQREALSLIENSVFAADALELPLDLFSHMGSSRWLHWGTDVAERADYPLQETISLWQNRILDQFFSPLTLNRVSDNEMKTPADEDALTIAELISSLTHSIFSELEPIKPGDYTPRQPAIKSVRRNLQRDYLTKLGDFVLGKTDVPEDARAIAAMELEQLRGRIENALAGDVKLDTYSAAHLHDLAKRIQKVLDAQMSV